MKPNPIARRLLEGGALFLIGDGIMGLLKPRRHSLLWDCGPQPIRSVTEGLAENPELARSVYLLEAAVGLLLAWRQTR